MPGLDAADFSKFLAMENSKLYELHKAVEYKKDWTMAKVLSPYLFKSYYNLKDLSAILIFETAAGGNKCIKEHLKG